MRDGVGVGHLEAPFLQIVAVIEQRAAYEKGALGIDHHADAGGLDHDVAVRRAIDQIHLVLQPRAAAADHRDAQGALRPPLPGQQRSELGAGGLRHLYQLLVADLVFNFAGLRSRGHVRPT